MLAAPRHETTITDAPRAQKDALAVVRRWIDAVNRRDADALVRLAHPTVTVNPTRLVRHDDRYGGHEGLRRWIAALVASDTTESVETTDIWQEPSGEFVATGEIMVDGRAVSPGTSLFVVRDGAVLSVRSYLSDEQTLRDVGHIHV